MLMGRCEVFIEWSEQFKVHLALLINLGQVGQLDARLVLHDGFVRGAL